ncbi:AAA family ATPase [Amycolatopsis japonica]
MQPARDSRRPRAPLVGRDEEERLAVSTLTARHEPPVVLISGPAGVGRTALWTRVVERAGETGIPVLTLRAPAPGTSRPYGFLWRFCGELAAKPLGYASQLAHALTRRIPRVPSDTSHIDLAKGLARTLQSAGPLIIAVDDLHWIDVESARVLALLPQALADGTVKVIAAARSWPFAPRWHSAKKDIADLSSRGFIEIIALRPLPASECRRLLSGIFDAQVPRSLSAELTREARNTPLYLHAAAIGGFESGSIAVNGRQVYEAPTARSFKLPDDHPIIAHLARFERPAYNILKAMSVLAPLGAHAVVLAAKFLETSTDELLFQLEGLCASGILRRTRLGWRFRVPIVSTVVRSRLGPYESRYLAALAVRAVWNGDAGANDRYFMELLVVAGRFVDRERAGLELYAQARSVIATDISTAERWLGAAAQLLTQPDERLRALLSHVSASTMLGRSQSAVASTTALSRDFADQMSAADLASLHMVHLVTLLATRGTAELERIGRQGWQLSRCEPAQSLVTQAAALHMQGNLRAARGLLHATHAKTRAGSDAAAAMAAVFESSLDFLSGASHQLHGYLQAGGSWPWDETPGNRFGRLLSWINVLMFAGETTSAERLCAESGLSPEHLPDAVRAILALQNGRWDDGLELAALSLAKGTSLQFPPAHTALCREAANAQLACGRLGRARSLLDSGRTEQPLLDYAFDLVEAELDSLLGRKQLSEDVLQNGLAKAAESGAVAGTDELWLAVAVEAVEAGDGRRARQCASELASVAKTMGTGRARLSALIARAVSIGDRLAAAEAAKLARERDRPFELANTLKLLAEHRLLHPAAMSEAYGLYGELRALLTRARLRPGMRTLDVTIPGRAETAAETDELLTRLIADGLTNQQLAAILRTSKKAVESRLTRLFGRSGLRSRTELAAVSLTETPFR